MSSKTANDMTWHAKSQTIEGWMNHPRDGDAWKYFDESYPDFASEPRNVQIGFCTDGFQTFSGKFEGNYSCWPVIVCVYNLPLGLCMKDSYMMLTLICLGPESPGRDLDELETRRFCAILHI
ncbi:hypothetical protein LIER_43327 [Lithospermum erythrorhizon]|uniref:Uncharacterized protein n=1 Tax=Lithospermum erythrorhizon TaxID=34254 RepID=A0AAV3PXH1_LITER